MIDWLAFLIVFGSALFAACVVVSLYSLGIRFLATPAPKPRDADGESYGPSRDDEDDDVEHDGRPRSATIAAYICFALAAGCVLFGIYLIVPALHG